MWCNYLRGKMMRTLCECGCGLATRLASRTRTDRGDIEGQPVRISYRASNKSWLHLACINYVKKEQRSGSSYATAISKLRQLWEREL